MKINGYILANRTQEVPIPIPGEEVQATVTAGNLSVHFESTDGKVPEEIHTDSVSNFSLLPVAWDQMEGSIPANFHCNYSLYSQSSYEKGWWIDNVTGTITFSGLTAGKYVAELTFYIGDRNKNMYDLTHPFSKVEAENINSVKMIRQGDLGIVYGELDPEMVTYQGSNTGIDDYGRVIKLTQRFNFTVAEGATSATITYGDSVMSLMDFCRVFICNLDSNGNIQQTHNQYGRCSLPWQFNILAKVYTDGRG